MAEELREETGHNYRHTRLKRMFGSTVFIVEGINRKQPFLLGEQVCFLYLAKTIKEKIAYCSVQERQFLFMYF